jgi:hypothetical protein
MSEEKDTLTLKWGTLKAWDLHSEKAGELLKEYGEIGHSLSAIAQKDTPRQKEIICELIDDCNADYIYNDWEGKEMTKEEAKTYVMEYGD